MLCGHPRAESLRCCRGHSLFVKDLVIIARPRFVLPRGAYDYTLLCVACCSRYGAHKIRLSLLIWPDWLTSHCTTIALKQVVDIGSAHLPHPCIRERHSDATPNSCHNWLCLLAALGHRLEVAARRARVQVCAAYFNWISLRQEVRSQGLSHGLLGLLCNCIVVP